MDSIKAIATLREMFSFYGKELEPTSIILKTWVKRLSEHINTNKELDSLVENIIANNRFLPTVEEALDFLYYDSELCAKKWLKLAEYCRTAHVIGISEDERKKLDPLLETAIEMMGGIKKLAMMNEDNFLKMEEQFKRVFKEICKQEKRTISEQKALIGYDDIEQKMLNPEVDFTEENKANSVADQLRKEYQNLPPVINPLSYNPVNEDGSLKQGEIWMSNKKMSEISEAVKRLAENKKLKR